MVQKTYEVALLTLDQKTFTEKVNTGNCYLNLQFTSASQSTVVIFSWLFQFIWFILSALISVASRHGKQLLSAKQL